MYLIKPQDHSRRAFLKRAGQLAFTGAALPTAINLAALGEAAAFNAGNDYKALVCVFLYGGSDYANTLIPADAASYGDYQTIRGTTGSTLQNGIALGRTPETIGGVNFPGINSSLLSPIASGAPQSAIGQTGLQYALHPSMTGMKSLFDTQKAAVLLNCGPLVVPLSKANYNNSNRTLYPLPPKLFSHNDQQSIWQSSSPEGSTIGWGGNIGDLALNSNGSNSLFTCISVTGNAVFLSGDTAIPYQVGRNGAVKINAVGSPYSFGSVGSAINQMIAPQQVNLSHILEREYGTVTKRAVNAEGAITSAIASTAATNNVFPAPFNAFPSGNSLADQLRMVARLIAARNTLNTKRQVFMVSLGGFDSHDNLMSDHARNMERVSSAIKSFYDCLNSADLNIANKVTTFTATDFGRTLSSNGDGSDHGWGSHQFIVGGAVNGGKFYGYAPPVSVSDTAALTDQWHVRQGRLLPSTSVDQYAATLAKWFGVSDLELVGTAGQSYRDSILPYLHNFGGTAHGVNYARDLGFMQAA
jgi:uncharacterized protein (DUF1501 family)